MKLRWIHVDGVEYGWRVEPGPDGLVVYRRDTNAYPLRVGFPPRDGHLAGDFARGVVSDGVRTWNVNRPAVVSALIRAGLAAGWAAEKRVGLAIEGWDHLDAAPLETL